MQCLCIQVRSVFCWKVYQKSQKDILRIGLSRCQQRNSRRIPVNIDFSCFRILLDRWSNEYCKWKIVSRSNDGGIKFEEFWRIKYWKILDSWHKIYKQQRELKTAIVRSRIWFVHFQPNLTWPKRRWRQRYEVLLIIGVLEARYVAG